MLHRVKKDGDLHEGKWNGLGGKLEPGERPEDCIIREISEETNGDITIKNPKLKGRIAFDDMEPDSKNTAHVYIFVIDEFECDITGDSPEGTLEWIPDDKILDLNLWDGDKVFLQWLDKPGFFSAKLLYDGEKLADYTVTFHS